MSLAVLIYLTLLTVVFGEKFRFDNYTLFRIVPHNSNHINLLQSLYENDSSYDFWNEPTSAARFVNIMSNPLKRQFLENTLNYYAISYEITMANVQEAIDREPVKTYTRNSPRSMTWDSYYTFDDIVTWMDDIVATFPEATEIIGGVSYEGRQLRGVKISHGSGRPVIFIEAGIHAREWISPATACYVISELVFSEDPEVRAAARDYDWYIIPVTNPDGYIWSHTDFRMWRKNRRPVGNTFGVDLNRNWNNNWLVVGASTIPTSQTYAGPGPFSEVETRTLSAYMRSIGDIALYLSVHSFGQLLLLPFGNSSEPLANYHDAMNIGRRAMGALSVRHGTQYITGNIGETLYLATGGSDDWVKETLKVPLVYCVELRDRGLNGFLLPPEEILPNNQEFMDGLMEMIHQGRRFGYLLNKSQGLQASVLLMVFVVMKFMLSFL